MAERTEKLILETEFKVTGAEASVTKVDSLLKATNSLTQANLQKVEADKKVEQAANQVGKAIQTETKLMSDLAKGLDQTGQAMNKIGQSNALKEAFKAEPVKNFSAEIKKFIETARGAKSIDELAASVKEFTDSLPADIRDDVISYVEKEAKKLEQTLIRPTTRLRELKRLINTETDPVLLQKYREEAGKLQDELGDTNDLVKALASDTFFADTVVEGAQQAVGAFTAFQGVLALTTEDQEEFAKAAAKAQGALALLQGTQQIITNLKKSDNIVTRTQILLQQGYEKVVGNSTGAMKGFKIALAATGIGLAVIAVGALVANWERLAAAIGLTNKTRELNNKIQKEAIENYAAEAAGIEVAKARLRDANTTQEERKAIIEDLQAKYPSYLSNIDAETASYDQVAAALNRVTNALFIKAKAEAAQELLTEKLKEQIRLQNSQIEDNLTLLDKAALLSVEISSPAQAAFLRQKIALENTSEAISENKKEVDDLLKITGDLLNELDNQGGDPAAAIEKNNEKYKKATAETRKILAGSIEALQAEVTQLTELRDQATVVGSEENLRANEELQAAIKRLEEAKKLYATPEDIELFTPGSIDALQKQIGDLNKLLNSLGEGEERNQAVENLTKAEKELSDLKKRLFGEELAQEKGFNTELLDEEERHLLAMQGIEEESDLSRLKTQLTYAKERLKLAEESGQVEENELIKLRNGVEEIEAQITASVAKSTKEQQDLRTQSILQTLDNVQQVIGAAAQLASTLIGIEEAKYARLSELQQERVNEAEEIADKGNVALLELEQERLDAINKQREKFVRRQQQLATIELIANSLIAVSKAAAAGGPAAPFTITATLLALAAGLASARAQANAQSFYKGGVYDPRNDRGGYTGFGPPGGQSLNVGRKPYDYHFQEHIMPHDVVRIGQNKDWLEKIRLNKIDIGRALNGREKIVVKSDQGILDAVKQRPSFTFNLNSRGIISIVEESARRSKRIESKR